MSYLSLKNKEEVEAAVHAEHQTHFSQKGSSNLTMTPGGLKGSEERSPAEQRKPEEERKRAS